MPPFLANPWPVAHTTPSAGMLIRRVDTTERKSDVYNPGQGAKPPETFNNHAYFALFALLAVAMSLASIWFFFWAKNGGFVWRKGDWDDYKTTVLRRKGKDGKTLSNATKSTNLGQGSVAGTFDVEREEMIQTSHHMSRGERGHGEDGTGRRHGGDQDVRAYRHEKPARVGGLNRQHDGSHFDYTNSDHSDVMSLPWDNGSTQHLQPKSGKKSAQKKDPPRKKKDISQKTQDKKLKRKDTARNATTDENNKALTGDAVPADYHRQEDSHNRDEISSLSGKAKSDVSYESAMCDSLNSDDERSHVCNSYYPQYRGNSHIYPDDSASRQGSQHWRSHQQTAQTSAANTLNRSRHHARKLPSRRLGRLTSVDGRPVTASGGLGMKTSPHHVQG